jgi:uncharacterized protein YciI
MPHFLIISHDNPGMEPVRKQVRADHLAHVKSGGDGILRVLVGSPLGHESMTGTWMVVEAASEDAVRAFNAGDPYEKAGLFASREILPIHDVFDPARVVAEDQL